MVAKWKLWFQPSRQGQAVRTQFDVAQALVREGAKFLGSGQIFVSRPTGVVEEYVFSLRSVY